MECKEQRTEISEQEKPYDVVLAQQTAETLFNIVGTGSIVYYGLTPVHYFNEIESVVVGSKNLMEIVEDELSGGYGGNSSVVKDDDIFIAAPHLGMPQESLDYIQQEIGGTLYYSEQTAPGPGGGADTPLDFVYISPTLKVDN